MNLGTFFFSASASGLNHCIEYKEDSLMDRTKARPLPSEQINLVAAYCLAFLLGLIGFVILYAKTNLLVLLIALLTLFSYVFIYTPLKKVTWLNTIVGAVPGALPPLAGAVSVLGYISFEAVILFTILFIWQLPHFYSIAWMYKDDYLKGGFKMIANHDFDGKKTAIHILYNVVLLSLLSLLPVFIGMVRDIYLVGIIACNFLFLKYSIKFLKERSFINARYVLRISLIYIFVLFLLVILDSYFSYLVNII